MNWVKLKAYEDGEFALNEILNRFEADVEEANRLPERVIAFRTFSVARDGDYCANIRRHSQHGWRTMLTLWVAEDNTVYCKGGSETIEAPIRAVPNEETGEVKWLLDNHLPDDQKQPIPLWQLSRSLLGRYVFEFK